MKFIIRSIRQYFVVVPIIYLFLTVFLLRHHVQLVYLSAILIVALNLVALKGAKLKPIEFLAMWMLVLGAIGISASVILSIEKIDLLANPDYVPSCSLSPVVACSPVIQSSQSSALGISNLYIGIFGFTAIFTAGMTILAGAIKLHKYWWRTLVTGVAFNAIFCMWLFYQGVFVIGKLCLYCMLVWLVTFALLWLSLAFAVDNRYVNLGKQLNNLLSSYRYELLAFTYTAIFVLIFYRWSDYWLSLL